MPLPVVKEGSRKSFRVNFNADNDRSFIPTSARYRVDSEDGTELVGWTTLTPAASLTITVSATANRILSDVNSSETKIITVQSDYGTDNQLSEQLSYQVVNLFAFST